MFNKGNLVMSAAEILIIYVNRPKYEPPPVSEPKTAI